MYFGPKKKVICAALLCILVRINSDYLANLSVWHVYRIKILAILLFYKKIILKCIKVLYKVPLFLGQNT